MALPPRERSTEASKVIDQVGPERIAENLKTPTPGVTSTRDRVRGDMDRFDLTNGGRTDPDKVYNNAGSDRVIGFVRDPAYWDRHGATDRVEQVKNLLPGAEIVTRKSDGRVVKEDDTVAVSYPREVWDEYREQEVREAAELTDAIENEDLPGQEDDTPEMRKMIAQRARAQSAAAGFGEGVSPTHGMSYKEAASIFGRDKAAVIAKEAEARRGGLHMDGPEKDQYVKDRLAENMERAKAAQKGKRVFGSPGGFDAAGRLVR